MSEHSLAENTFARQSADHEPSLSHIGMITATAIDATAPVAGKTYTKYSTRSSSGSLNCKILGCCTARYQLQPTICPQATAGTMHWDLLLFQKICLEFTNNFLSVIATCLNWLYAACTKYTDIHFIYETDNGGFLKFQQKEFSFASLRSSDELFQDL